MDYTNQPMGYNNEAPKKSGMAIASLVLGIISIPACCYGIGILLGIIGIVLGAMSKKDTGKMSGMAIAGIICSGFGIAFGILFWVLFAIGIYAMEFGDLSNFYYY